MGGGHEIIGELAVVTACQGRAVDLVKPSGTAAHVAAETVIDWQSGSWSPVRKPRRSAAGFETSDKFLDYPDLRCQLEELEVPRFEKLKDKIWTAMSGCEAPQAKVLNQVLVWMADDTP